MPYSFFSKYNSNLKSNLLSSDGLNFRTSLTEGGIYTQYGYPTRPLENAFSKNRAINGGYANLEYSQFRLLNMDDLVWGNMRSADISEIIIRSKKTIIQYLLNLNFSFVPFYRFAFIFVLFSNSVYSQTQDGEPTLIVAPIQGPINTEFQEFGPTMTPDAKTLYFYSKRSSKGYTEIFKSERKKDGTWDFPEEVDVLNSPFDDQSPFISRDGKTLLLSSNRDGSVEVMLPDGKVGISRDLYVSNWNGKEWNQPVALPAPINTEEIEENPHLLGDTLLLQGILLVNQILQKCILANSKMKSGLRQNG